MLGAAIDDVAAMLRLRAASKALQKHWGDGDDPQVWKGVEWSEQGRVVVLNLQGISELIVLPAEKLPQDARDLQLAVISSSHKKSE